MYLRGQLQGHKVIYSWSDRKVLSKGKHLLCRLPLAWQTFRDYFFIYPASVRFSSLFFPFFSVTRGWQATHVLRGVLHSSEITKTYPFLRFKSSDKVKDFVTGCPDGRMRFKKKITSFEWFYLYYKYLINFI